MNVRCDASPSEAALWDERWWAYERAAAAERADAKDPDAVLALVTALRGLSEAWRALSVRWTEPLWLGLALRLAETVAVHEAEWWDQRLTILAARPWWVPMWALPASARRRPPLTGGTVPNDGRPTISDEAAEARWARAFAWWERVGAAERKNPADPTRVRTLAAATHELADGWQTLAQVDELAWFARVAVRIAAAHTCGQAYYWDRRVRLLRAVRWGRRDQVVPR